MGSAGPRILACLKTSVTGRAVTPFGAAARARGAQARPAWPSPSRRSRARRLPEQARQHLAEDRGAQTEGLGQRRGRARGPTLLPPRRQMLFRPEEVERVSERRARLAAQVAALAYPGHEVDRRRPAPRASRRARSARRSGDSASAPSPAAQERRDAERVDRAAGPALAAAGQDRDEIRRVFRRRDRPDAPGLRTRRSDPVRPAPRRRRRCRAARCRPGLRRRRKRRGSRAA